MKVPFAAILRALRSQKGLTQESIPEGSNRQYLRQLEHEKSSPTFNKLQDLSEAFGVSTVVLIGAATAVKEDLTVDGLIAKFTAQMKALEAEGILAAARAELSGELLTSPAGRVIDPALRASIQECKAQGQTQAQTCQNLGVNKMTVSRYWRDPD
ncbi:helix-turn-helix domain-containing protein [Pseudomonas mandelii]|uniref:XRE family transcriptional regulator n=1 Tax=Pseudomonas mandelii TaxID=75612 RepID=A0A502HR45_9PSED|nr:helix-turn-helix transcriptional regulator [Pseudomonas mandelii]TPG77227.1 XRE family transcriptional regulator [Pseudomonas mandelii]